MKRFTLLILMIATFLTACGGSGGGSIMPPDQQPVFTSGGLDGKSVYEIRRIDDSLIAATDDGLYGKTLGEDVWNPLGLDDDLVADIVLYDDQHWLAAVFAGGSRSGESMLMETRNAGANWLRIANDFGGTASQSESIHALHYDESNARLYATGQDSLAVSDDGGSNWQLVDGVWNSASNPLEALARNPATGDIWYGGQNSIEQMVLRRYDPITGTSESFPNLLPSPATIKGIRFDAADPDRVLASGEGGVLETEDNGGSWTNLLGEVDYRFYFEVEPDPARQSTLFTAGISKPVDEPQPLVLEISTDDGQSWTAYEFGGADFFGGAVSLLATARGGETELYIGLRDGGIVEVTSLPNT